MSREIKFRVFDTKTKEYLTPKGGDFSLGVLSGEVRGIYGEKFTEIIVEQYTGLKDKNGVEIYEGDIVKYKTYYYSKEKEVIEEVKWIDNGYTDLFGEPSMYGFLIHWEECEIIGNIYQNPELLK